MNKDLYFQYVLHKLLNWYPNELENDLSVLKALKLLFFVTAAKSSEDEPNSLVDIFNNYYAMPLGHVESDIYTSIKGNSGRFEYYIIGGNKTEKVVGNSILDNLTGLNETYLRQIDSAVEYLRDNYSDLINLSPSDLVELSHLWYSWKKNYYTGLKLGRKSTEIPISDIKSEEKIFNLPVF